MALSLLIYLDRLRFGNFNERSDNDEEEFKFDSKKVLEYAYGDMSAEDFIELLDKLEERRQIDRRMAREFEKLFNLIRTQPKPALGS